MIRGSEGLNNGSASKMAIEEFVVVKISPDGFITSK